MPDISKESKNVDESSRRFLAKFIRLLPVRDACETIARKMRKKKLPRLDKNVKTR
jgi:hypothetical protein